MRVLETRVSKKVVALAASVALGAGSIVALAPVASAAPGDTTSFSTGVAATDVAADASGNLWVTNQGSGSISKVALDGTTVTFGVPITQPFRIAAGPSGNMWFTDLAGSNVGRITADGVAEAFGNGIPQPTSDIAQGPDGNMWFTMQASTQVGKITPSGDVTLYDTGNLAYFWITPGPQGSNRMYLASQASNFLGFITMNGQFTEIAGPQGAVVASEITLVNDQVWFLAEQPFGSPVNPILTRLVADRTYTQVSNPALQAANAIGTGLNGTMWVGTNQGTISHVTTAGDVVATYDIGVEARSLVQANDGNVWAATNNSITRVLTGVVPTSSAAPAVDPASGLTAGAVVSASNGSWNYLPSSYSYQWQVCETSDVASCVDAAGSTGQSYTVATADVGKYIRVGVRASNLNGPSEPAYSGVVATGEAPAPAPNPNPNPVPATGEVAVIGNGATMELDAPSRQKRRSKKFYEVFFSVEDAQGAVVFEFRKGKRTKTKTVAIEDGIAEYRWKTPRRWRKGRTTVTATYIPAAGSPYAAAEVKDRVRIR